ncbi:hypothetical protein E2562_029561 [Oryza meyeriana var. granulata]|uniref:Uncharacterized protein n=1 Tax=Oryza meyeriana var. granulata TaxID=110450 RepID=A0A6G1CA26_9ORYZ|nr:hypothetical protein E2562_029561 [Oryza meyeriana var. granulata]
MRPMGGTATGAPEIFTGRSRGTVRRTIVIENSYVGAEKQCLDFVRTLSLANRLMLYVYLRIQCIRSNWPGSSMPHIYLKVYQIYQS